jgi:hypothetical protein
MFGVLLCGSVAVNSPVQLDSGQAWLDLRLDVMETSMCMQLVATLAYCVRADSKRGNS